MFERLIKRREKFNLENTLEILADRLKIESETLKPIIEEVINSSGEYFNEEEAINRVEEIVNKNIDDETLKNNLLTKLIVERDGKRYLNEDVCVALEDIFRKSPEKKGINFRDKIEDPKELRGWLYLMTKDNKFKGNFERLISQKDKFYFRLWPPRIGIGFKSLLPPRSELRPEFKPGEFFQEIRSYIEDIQKEKSRITFWFEESLLPDEFKKDGVPDEEKLKQAGVERKGSIYEFYITTDKLKDIFDVWLGTYTETVKGESEINNLFKETYDLYNSLLKDASLDIKDNLRAIGSFLKSLEEVYKEMIETGASKEDLEKIREGLNKCKQFLEELRPDIDEYKKNKDSGIASKIWIKTKDFLKVSGITILTSFGFWGLTIGWFLPLWLIVKMDEAISKYLGYKH